MSGAQPTSNISGREVVLKVSHTEDFEVTGDGSNKAWMQTEWIIVPYRQGPKSYKTRAKLLYSEAGIYFLFDCQDDKIVSTLREDFADLYREDVVEVFFWPDESVPMYFEYELSPSNYELPILVPNFGGTFLGWRPWHYEGERKTRHAAHINGQDWMVECFIPYALLRPLRNSPPKKGTTWRANMYRLDYDDGQTRWSWQPTRVNFHDYESFGTLLFD